jgi:hypothetical protein
LGNHNIGPAVQAPNQFGQELGAVGEVSVEKYGDVPLRTV